jgi:hypothetical protein
VIVPIPVTPVVLWVRFIFPVKKQTVSEATGVTDFPGFTLMVFVTTAGLQDPPLAVSCKVIRPNALSFAPAVYLALAGLLALVQVPVPFRLVQTPPVAAPPILPPIGTEVSPSHISAKAAPGFAVGPEVIVRVFVAVATPQAPPVVVRVKVIVPVSAAPAV